MKLYKFRISVALLVGLLLQSCLNLDPKDQLGETSHWSSPKDFELFANQFYDWTRDFKRLGKHEDIKSDIYTSTNFDPVSNGTNTIPASDGDYTGAYNKIRRTNLLLKNAATYSSPNDIKQFVGEAKFFRAYCYFELVQLFGDAIIVTKPLDVTDPEMKMKRHDRGDVIDFIINDLKEASVMLPDASNISSNQEGRISSQGCMAFLSRVALYEGTWQKFRENQMRGVKLLDEAAKAALTVIDGGKFELFKPKVLADSAQKYMFILENTKSNPASLQKNANKEYIFVNRHDEVIAPAGTNITHGALCNVIFISRKMATMYLCDDGLPIEKSTSFKGYATPTSEFENRDSRMRYTMARPLDYFWSNDNPRIDWSGSQQELDNAQFKKLMLNRGTGYNNQKWATERTLKDGNEGYDYPIIRYAEVLLNYAEAVFERDDAINDDDLNISLNLVRNRVNAKMPRLSNNFVTTNGLDMRTEIRRERTVELFYEHFRFDDLKRWKTAETEMPMDILGIKWTGTEYQTKYWPGCTVPRNAQGYLVFETDRKWHEKNYLFPIPTDQLQLNPNLKQNPGWK